MYILFIVSKLNVTHIFQDSQELFKGLDPFFETQENHNLIGVANIFLEVLFHDVTLDYYTPIISQQGEVAGRLQVGVVTKIFQFWWLLPLLELSL